jgi:hypothetical protein
MPSLLITYDLVGTDATSENYKLLIEQIKALGRWGHLQDSVWIVKTEATAKSVPT